MIQRNQALINFLHKILDIGLNLCAFMAALLLLRENLAFPHDLETKLIVLLAFIVVEFLYCMFGMYESMRTQPLGKTALQVLRANVIIAIILIAVAFIFFSEREYIYLIALTMLISDFVLVLKRVLVLLLLRFLRKHNYNIKYVIVIGSSGGVQAYRNVIESNPHYGYHIIGYVSDNPEIGTPYLGKIDDLRDVLLANPPYEVICAPDTAEQMRLEEITAVCDNLGLRVSIVPQIFPYLRSDFQIDRIGYIPLINMRKIPLDNLANAFVKRLVDILGSIVLIILTSPLMIFAAIGIRLTTDTKDEDGKREGVIYKQERIGKNNKPFLMYKFRSMANEGDGEKHKTRFGVFLRTTAIDELPQFFNVLKGDMSLVGPRPETTYYVDYFSRRVQLYMVKHMVKPGITGLAQIKGLRGDTDIVERIDADISYIENWSFALDVLILLKTPFRFLNLHEKDRVKGGTQPKLRKETQSEDGKAEEKPQNEAEKNNEEND